MTGSQLCKGLCRSQLPQRLSATNEKGLVRPPTPDWLNASQAAQRMAVSRQPDLDGLRFHHRQVQLPLCVLLRKSWTQTSYCQQ